MADRHSKAEKTADKVVDTRDLSPEDAEGARRAWLNAHNDRIGSFRHQLRDTGVHPVTGVSVRYPDGVEVPEDHHEAMVDRYEDYLLGEYEADAKVRNPHHHG